MATKTWNGSTADWYTAADWSGGTLPASTDDVLIPSGDPFLVSGDAAITVASITINGGGTWQVRNTGNTEMITGNLSNAGTLDVDNQYPNFNGDGGSSLAIGQTLSNSGTVNIGNYLLSSPTTVTATGLSNSGTINLTGSTTKLATLDDTGAAPTTSGNINISGDALLEFGSGAVTSIASGTTFSLRNDPTPIALNAGTPGGTFSNAGTLDVDNQYPNFNGDGGSSLAIGQTLSNSGTVNIGNYLLSSPTTVTATGLSNSGTINLTGSTTKLATLDDTGAAPTTSGNINISGDALLEFGSGAVTSIASGTTFSLRNDPTPIALNAGTPGGTFSNAGTLDVDNQYPNFNGDGGSSLAIGQTLSNSGTVNIGNYLLSSPTTVTATGLSNSGTINLTGSTTKLATLDDTGAAPTTSGNINISGDALLEFGSGAVTSIASGTTFSLRNDPTPIALNAGTPGGTFSNAGTLDVDNQYPNFNGDGGSSLAIGQTLSNSGTVNIGNYLLSSPTTVTATGLSNSGTINLTGSTTKLATLDDTGAAPTTSGNINISGDALLEFGSGAVTSIASGTTFSLRNDPTPIALNAGTPGGTFSNAGTLDVDNQYPNFNGDGGSSLAIGQTLSNSGTVNIGNYLLSSPTTVTATGLSNSGTINLTGSTTKLATLDDTGAAPTTSGNINISGDALLEFGSGAVTSIASGTTFSLRNDPTPIALNAGTPGGTFSNAGTLDVDNQYPNFNGDGGSSLAIGQTLSNSGTVNIGNYLLSSPTTVTATGLSNSGTINLTGSTTKLATLDDTGAAPTTSGNINISGDALLEFGSGAVTSIASGTTFSLRNDPTPIALNAGTPGGTFSNAGTLDVDNQYPNFNGDGGSSLAIGQTLSNSGTVNIGNYLLSSPTTVTATGLSNSGTINLTGSTTKLATLDDTGAAPTTSGNINISGDALLEFGSGAVTSIASGTTFSLRNDPTPIALNAGTPGGTFSNAGTLDVDNQYPNFNGDGGSSLAIGQTLSNSGTVNIGNYLLSSPTTVTATGLSNSGTINLTGSTTKLATLDDTGAAPTTSGNINISGDALLEFGSGAVTSIASGTTFSLRNDPTPIALNAGTPGGTFSNAGTLDVDNQYPNFNGDGGSSLAIGQTLSNSGTVNIGNYLLSSPTTVTATGLSNSGTINLTGSSSSHEATLTLTGPAGNSGTMNVGGFSAINAGGEIYTQSLGTTTLAATGALTAKTIDVTGGVFQGAGTVTGNIVNTGGSVAGGTYTSNSPGTLTVTGTYSQSGSGILQEILTGTAAGQQSELAVSGDANIQGGTLNADVSFGLAAGETFTVMTFAPGTLPGLFGAIDYGSSVGNRTFVNISGGLTLGALYNVAAGNIELQVLTTPTTADSWNGGSGNWSTAADWTTGVVPTSDTDVTIGQTASGTVTLDTGDTIDSLTITSGNTLNFAANEALVVGASVTVQSGGALTLGGGDGLEVGGTLGVAGQMTVGAGATVELFSTPLNVTGTLTVAGEIETAGATAVTMGSGIDRLILDPGFSFVGLVQGGGVNSTLELAAGAGTGVLNALGTEFTDFGTVRVDAGATWTVDALAAALSGVTITGSDGSNTLVITSSGAADLSGVSGFPTIDLASGGNNVAVTNNIFALTPPDGSVTINVTGGNNSISAAGDTSASTGKTLTYVAATGIDSFTGGFENDVVYVPAAAVGGDTLTGGSGTNTLVLKSAGMFSLGGVSKFGTIDLAAGNSTVAVTDTTLSGGLVTIWDGASGNNSISAAGDTSASTGKTLRYVAGAGIDSFTGGFENDVVYVPAAAVGGDTLTGGSGTNTLVLRSAGTFSLGGVSKFGTIDLAAGNSTVTVTDTTLSGGSVRINDGASGNNSISAAGDTSASTGKTLTYVAGTGIDSFTGGFENDVVYVPAAAVGGDTLTGGSGTNTLVLTTEGTFNLSGLSGFWTIDLAPSNNTVTVTLSGGSVRINDGASGNNTISAAGDTSASTGKTLTYMAGAGTDSFTGGFENDVVYVPAAAVGGDTLTGGSGTNTLVLKSAGTFSLGGVSKFATIDLFAGNSTVTVTDTTLSGGSVTIWDGASGNNSISAAGDTSASTGKTLRYVAGAGIDSFTGGFENDVVYVPAAAVGGDTLTGGSGTNTLVLRSAGTFSLGGVSKFGTIDLAAGNSTVTVTDTTLSGGLVRINDGASGNNTISAAGDTSASTGKTLTYMAGTGTDSFTGGFENDVVYVPAAAVGGDTLTGGSGTNTLVLRSAGTFSLGGVSKFATIDLFAGNSTVTVTDTTLSGGSVTIWDGASGNNSISAAGDTSASTGKTLRYVAGAGIDSFTGGFENDVVYVPAAAVGGDTLTGGSGTNTLVLRSAGTFSLGGVSKFGTIDLAAGNSTVTVTDTTLSGGLVRINDGASGNNTISAAGDTSASTGKTLTYMAGTGTDSFTGGFENDVVYVPAAAVGGDTLTGGSGTNTLNVSGGGAAVMGSTITGISTVNLLKAPSGQTQPDYDFTANTLSGLLVDDLNTTTPDALVAGGNRQTLTGGGAGMLTMDAANQSSALLKDSASVFSGDTTKDLVNGDMIDITGLGFSAVNTSLGFVYNSGSDTTTMSVALSGTQKTAITLLGQYMAADFSVSADTAGTGTLITLTHELNLTMPH